MIRFLSAVPTLLATTVVIAVLMLWAPVSYAIPLTLLLQYRSRNHRSCVSRVPFGSDLWELRVSGL